jgi:hypothetical protein
MFTLLPTEIKMALTRAKRLKLQHEAEHAKEIVIDPIEVIREPLLQDLIFQHLSGSDVKNLFTVSKTWNQAASESSKAMSKIELHVSESGDRLATGSFPLKDIKILLNSNRRYQHARFWLRRETNINRKLLLLERFSPSLVGLEYFCDTETANSTANSEWNFPKLEWLYMSTFSEHQSIGVLQGATVLMQLVLGCSSMPRLMSVSSSLTSLRIFECSKEELEYILASFPNLKDFFVGVLSFIEISKLENQSITEFTFGVGKLPNNTISSMKNLEFCHCFTCDEPNLRKILTEGKRLKKVKVEGWNTHENLSPIEVYETLMASDRSIPRNIEIVF